MIRVNRSCNHSIVTLSLARLSVRNIRPPDINYFLIRQKLLALDMSRVQNDNITATCCPSVLLNFGSTREKVL